MNRALLIDPDNWNMRYNFSCILITFLNDIEVALDLLEPVLKSVSTGMLSYAKTDPDLAVLHDHPRFMAMTAAAEARLAAGHDGRSSPMVSTKVE